jgi:periplasmic protein TonB
MTAPAATPLMITTGDRLVTTLFFAILIHGIVILGVTFAPEDAGALRAPTLEVTLVRESSEAPEEAEYLAQANLDGGGNTEEQVRPTSQLASPSQVDHPGEPDGDRVETADPGVEDQQEDVGETTAGPTADSTLIATTGRNEQTVQDNPAAAPSQRAPVLYVPILMDSSPDQADPVDHLDRQALAQSDDPRESFVAVDTQEALFAPYLARWRDRIERMGNLHYPDQARRDGIEGSLILEVAINANGTIRDLDILRASSHRTLDRAALRILRLASPFEPFPEDLRRETDVVRFIYEWRFGSEQPGTLRATGSG